MHVDRMALALNGVFLLGLVAGYALGRWRNIR